jgi:hypothetical protein
VVGLGTLALSVQALEQYGAALFIGAPFLFGFTSGITYARLVSPRFSGALAAAVVGLGISAAVMIEFAIEGIVCLLMSIPLAVPEAALGAWLGVLGARGSRRGARAAAGGALGLLPCLLVADVATPLPPAPTSPVETVRVIAAPAETVWERVVAFPEMDAPTGWLFRMGIAAPLGATIRGEGVGGVRECRFTTGSFVEPIEVWERGRELTFAVASQPDPMREWVLWEGPRPPHLTGFLQTTRGQFLLQELPDGGTRLIGRTWYRTNMVPEAYWRLFADAIIHAIHGRVLDHVARLAEADVRAGRASRG